MAIYPEVAPSTNYNAPTTDSALILSDVARFYGEVKVYENLNLSIARHEFVAVVGPSGCGKTTLLNLLSGYDKPTAGQIERHGQVRTVYQQDGLFPWLTARENILLGLRHVKEEGAWLRKLKVLNQGIQQAFRSRQKNGIAQGFHVVPNILLGLRHVKEEGEKQARLRELLDLIHLDGFADHYPHQLSGGMKQRVEIARALAGDADILLLDEPFSALDYLTRLRMRRELERLLAEHPRTVVFVTHDVEEAAHLADRVVVLSERPAKIQCELRIHGPRPRDIAAPEVINAVKRILQEMGLED